MGWGGPRPTRKNLKKSITVGLFYEILINFTAALVFDISKSPLIDLVAYLKN